MIKELEDEIEKYDFVQQHKILEYIKRRIKNNARYKVNRFVERKLPNLKKKCQVCNSEKNIEFHHVDYSKPYLVNLLCKECHVKYHNNTLGKTPKAMDLEKKVKKNKKILDKSGKK